LQQAWPFNLRVLQEAPLPLAQLCAKAQSENAPQRRHDTAFSAFDVFLKLLSSLATAEKKHLAARAANVPGLSAGDVAVKPFGNDWLERLRADSQILHKAGVKEFRFLFQATLANNFPACRALGDVLGPHFAPKTPRKKIADILQLVGTYRNKGFKQGGATDAECEEVGRLIFSALMEILAGGNAFANRRFVYVESVTSTESGTWRLDHLDLQGMTPIRLRPLELAAAEQHRFPAPERVYAVNSLATSQATVDEAQMYSPSRCVSLYPLLGYDPEHQECLFAETFASDDRAPIRYLGYSQGVTFQVDRRLANPGADNNVPATIATELSGTTTRRRLFAAGRDAHPDESGLRDFEIVAQVAAGSYAAVYRAWQHGVDRHVALKRICPAAPVHAEAGLNNEIRLLGQVTHPNLIQVLTRGHDSPWFTMPFIEGPTLADVLQALWGFGSLTLSADDFLASLQTAAGAADQRAEQLTIAAGLTPQNGTPVRHAPQAEYQPAATGETYLYHVVKLVGQLAAAVGTLHRHQIVLRNIHPGNVLISTTCRQPVLIDLGDARLSAETSASPLDLKPVDKLHYASPEQIDARRQIDRSTDVYSLGVLLWELLARQPFLGIGPQTDWHEARLRIQHDVPEPVRKHDSMIPDGLNAAVSRCLAKDPAERLASADELSRILADFERSELETGRRGSWASGFVDSLLWRFGSKKSDAS